jgi:hypothetical protein
MHNNQYNHMKMSARITRSQSKAHPAKAETLAPKIVLRLKTPVKTLTKGSLRQNKEVQLAAREAALFKKEAELATREAALLKKEAELAAREAELSAKPAKKDALAKQKKETKGKQFMINYISDYQGMDAESEVFVGSDEKTVALEVFDWIVENRKGLDFEMALDSLQMDGDDRFGDEEELATHVRKTCKSFKDLKKICEKYNDSYFEDYNGWKLKFSQK